MIGFDNFEQVDFRVGTVVQVDTFPKAKKPAYQLTIDFGPLGVLKSSAQITTRYSITEMLRTQKTSYKEHQKRIPYNVCATKNGNCSYSTKQERCSLGCHPLPEDSDEE